MEPIRVHPYNQIADWYAVSRQPSVGVAEVLACVRPLGAGAKVLDLGCGTGFPITQALLQEGCQVYGLDSAEEMVARFRASFPDVPVRCALLQESDFFGLQFDAVVAWGVLFHLNGADQEQAIARVAQHLRPGGRFLFTAGDEPGETDGTMHGVLLHYVSLGTAAYRKVLAAHGLDLLVAWHDAWDNCYFVAEKPF